MIEIRRGSTPTIEVELDMALADFSQIHIDLVQETDIGTVKVEKTLADCRTEGENILSFKLSQEETLSLTDGKKAELQLKGKTPQGDVLTTDIIEVTVRRVLDGEVI